MQQLVIFDFETSGLRPDRGARVIELGAVLVENESIVARFQSLINPGLPISPFITGLTGITNSMLAKAPGAASVLPEFCVFSGGLPLAAHNARFDRAFLTAELARLGINFKPQVLCTLLAARRIIPEAPRYRLSGLAEYCGVKVRNHWHRALDDAEATARLWAYMMARLRSDYGFTDIPARLVGELNKVRGQQVPNWLRAQAAQIL